MGERVPADGGVRRPHRVPRPEGVVGVQASWREVGGLRSRSPEGRPSQNVPWPVRRGGLWLRLYENSLFIVFLILFLTSLSLHAVTGARAFSSEQKEHGEQPVTAVEYARTSQFWYESFQNWQSEFLAVGSIVLFSVWLRQRGSPESKPVDAPHSETA